MASLHEFINTLEQAGELKRISTPLSPELAITELADRLVKNNGPALLIENNGSNFPVLINMFASDKRMAIALGVNKLDDIGERIASLFKTVTSPKATLMDKLRMLPLLSQMANWMPELKKGKGSCQEIIHAQPDLSILPILKCWPHDGGKFITFPLVHTVDPHTGIRNTGMYRMQVFSSTSTGMHWHRHKGGAAHYKEYKALNKRMPVSVALGGDPVYTYVACAPLPENIDEYMLAGFLRNKKVSLVKSVTNDIYVPADADIIIEGYIDTAEPLRTEGPFGDHTGFYSLEDEYPIFHVTCITHKKNAIYPTTIVGIPPMEDAWLGKATERLFLPLIQLSVVPELKDMYMPAEGVFHNIVIASIRKSYPGQAIKVMSALWGAGQMMFNKIMIIVDEDVDIYNPIALLNAIKENTGIPDDLHLMKGPLDVLDHASKVTGFGSKIGIDATRKLKEETASASISCDTMNITAALKEMNMEANYALLEQGLPFLIIYTDAKAQAVVNLHKTIANTNAVKGIKAILYIDKDIRPAGLQHVIWYAANNIEPLRDICIENNIAGINATRKTLADDGFKRRWPNIITSTDETIQLIDMVWKDLELGEFIPSPSLAFKSMIKPGGASIKE